MLPFLREDEKQLISVLDTIKREVQGDLVINLNVQVEDQANLLIQNEILKRIKYLYVCFV